MGREPTLSDTLNLIQEAAFVVTREGKLLGANQRAEQQLAPFMAGPEKLRAACEAGGALQSALTISARSSGAVPVRLTLEGQDGPVTMKGTCQRLSRDGEARFGFRVIPAEESRFSLLTQKINDLQEEVYRRKLAQASLAQSLKENKNLLRELQHRVKNNLQFLSSLLVRQASDTPSVDPMTLALETRTRLYAIGVAQDLMYRQEQFHSVGIEEFLEAFSHNIAPLNGTEHALTVELEEDWHVPNDALTALALVLGEMLMVFDRNAVPGTTTIACFREGSAHVISVTLPPSSPTGPCENSDRPLLEGLAKQIGATLKCPEPGGRQAALVFPER